MRHVFLALLFFASSATAQELASLVLRGPSANPSAASGFTYLDGTGAGSTDNNNVTTTGIDASKANLIVLQLTYDTTQPTITDSGSNSWASACLTEQNTFGGGPRTRLCYLYAPTVSGSYTVTLSSTGQSPSVSVLAFSGAVSSPLDVNTGTTGSCAVETKATGSGTPANNNQVVIAGFGYDGTGTLSESTGFTIVGQKATVGGQHYGGAIAYKIQTTAGAENASFSWTGAACAATNLASFKSQ